jgi:outer membrane lipoprotein-sorting protein
MKKIIEFSLTLIMVAMLFAGCGGSGEKTTTVATITTTSAAATTKATTSTAPTTTTGIKTTVATTTATSGNAFSDLLAKSTGITNFYCEIKITVPAGVQNYKYWVKMGNPIKFRMEISAAGQTMLMIYDGQYYYMYDPASKVAYKMSAASAEQYASASGDASDATQYNPVLVGSETVNGVDCYVYQYTLQGTTTKMWLSKQDGLTIRIASGTMTMDYTNYKFDTIADSMFMLPSDAMMMTMPA